jgi:hypothetical protein
MTRLNRRRWLETELTLTRAQIKRLVDYKTRTLGLYCEVGHHTRYADVIGDPGSPDWVCPHCFFINSLRSEA